VFTPGYKVRRHFTKKYWMLRIQHEKEWLERKNMDVNENWHLEGTPLLDKEKGAKKDQPS
jgi:hypothetical protein